MESSKPISFESFPKGTLSLAVVLTTLVILLSPLTAVGYYRRRHTFPLKGRGWKLLLVLFSILPILCILILLAFVSKTPVPVWVYSVAIGFSMVTAGVVYMFRAWRLLFSFKLTEKVVEINDLVERGEFAQLQALQNNFFLRNRQWIKPSRFGTLFCVIQGMFYLGASLIIVLVNKVGANGLFSGALTLIPVSFALVAACGLRSFKGDAHFVKLELSVVGCFIFFAFIIFAIVYYKLRLAAIGVVFLLIVYIAMLICSGVVPVLHSYKAEREERLLRDVEHIETYFRRLLSNHFGFESFLRFAKSEFSSENVLFWRDLEKVHSGQIRAPIDIQIHLRRVYTTYVLDTSAFQVNISGEKRLALDVAFGRLGKWEDETEVELAPWLSAQTEVFKLMKKDSLRRYLYSPQYEEFKAGGGRVDLELVNKKLTEHMSIRPNSSQKSNDTRTGSGLDRHSDEKGSKGAERADSPKSPPSARSSRTHSALHEPLAGRMFVYSSGNHNEFGDLFKASDIIERQQVASETIEVDIIDRKHQPRSLDQQDQELGTAQKELEIAQKKELETAQYKELGTAQNQVLEVASIAQAIPHTKMI